MLYSQNFKMEFTPSDARSDLIRYLYQTSKQHLIKISATKNRNPIGSVNFYPAHAIDGDSNTRYGSISIDNPYFELSFSSFSFLLKNYSLQYINTIGQETRHPISWELTGRNGNSEIKSLDIINKNYILKDKKQHYFTVSPEKYGFFSTFRITLNGINGFQTDKALYISEIELFGVIHFNKDPQTCSNFIFSKFFNKILIITLNINS